MIPPFLTVFLENYTPNLLWNSNQTAKGA
uniref:Uncharacterized protein n=1 Tax=Anguilla anguilla TaxID=7936 RepID=A0A0E9QAH3_ANGAN